MVAKRDKSNTKVIDPKKVKNISQILVNDLVSQGIDRVEAEKEVAKIFCQKFTQVH
ncbi:hypothetical protein [Photobacterium aquae]|uniref:hypothetical protein n=1 Tax=Photobacterium aquae TaxID=1195763 RepID=UPI000B1B5834|nr:hypothetical protein [Photobacterium aquae]